MLIDNLFTKFRFKSVYKRNTRLLCSKVQREKKSCRSISVFWANFYNLTFLEHFLLHYVNSL